VLTLVVFEGVYLIAGNAIIWLWLQEKIATTKDTRLRYASGWSVWPGVIHVKNFSLTNEDSSIQWMLRLREATFTLDFFDLPGQKFHASSIRAEGVEFRLRLKRTKEQAKDPRVAALPPIPGFADPPLVPDVAPPPVTDAHYDLWRVQLDDVEAGVEEVWVEDARVVGPGRVSGTFYFKPMRVLSIGPLDVRFDGVGVRLAERELMRDLRGSATVLCSEYDPREASELLVRAFSGSMDGAAQVPDASSTDLILGPDAPVRFTDGSGQLELSGHLDNGVLRGGSWLRYETDHVHVASQPLVADVAASLEARSVGALGGPRAEVDVALRSAVLSRPSGVRAEPVTLRGAARLRDVSADLLSLRSPRVDLDASLRAPELAWFTDASDEAAKRPRLTRGRGAVALRARLEHDGLAHGFVAARLARAELGVKDDALRADASLRGGFDDVDVGSATGRVRDVSLEARRVDVLRGGAWRGGGAVDAAIERGSWTAAGPRDVRARVDATLADAGFLATDDRMGVLAGRARATATIAFDRLEDATAELDASLLGGSVRTPIARASGDVRVKGKLTHADLARGVAQIVGASIATSALTIDRGDGTDRRSTLASARVDVAQLDLDAWRPLGFRADVDARVSDVGALAGKDAPVRGAARLEGSFGRAYGGDLVRGLVSFAVHDADVTVAKSTLVFDARATTRVEADVDALSLRLRDAHVTLDHASAGAATEAPERGAWWATVDAPLVDIARAFRAGRPTVDVAFDARVHARDGGPPLDVLARADVVPGWVAAVVAFEDLDGRAVVRKDDAGLALRFDVTSDDARVRGAVLDRGAGVDGDVVAWLGALSVGVDVARGETHVHPLVGNAWLTKQLARLGSP
jgi:hypothetical protein